MADNWLSPSPSPADLTGDGSTDYSDLALLAGSWLDHSATVLISEFMAYNRDSITDIDGDTSDWIELYNPMPQNINLKGWYLTDDSSDLTKWRLPSLEIPSDSFAVIFASGKDRSDPDAELHTNFALDSQGEFLALVKPDGTTIAHQYETYPNQYFDISYGLGNVSAHTYDEILMDTDHIAFAKIPMDDSMGDSWTNPGFQTFGWLKGKAAIGYDYGSLIDLDVSDMRYSNQSVYVRIPFTVDQLTDLSKLILRLKYEDGIAVYLNGHQILSENAPETLTYNSGALENRPDSIAVEDEDFDITKYKDFLALGENVLAFQGLNVNLSSSDLLIYPKLIATYTNIGNSTDISQLYMSPPTPGAVNESGTLNPGPCITDVTENPSQPADDEDIVITAKVSPTKNSIAGVSLHYRINYAPKVQIDMVDDGSQYDQKALDGIYTAAIPASAAGHNDMVRWFVTATDSEGETSRAPLFPYPENSPEYYGTVITDASLQTQMPRIQWYVQDVAASESRSGTRGSVYYLGQFYDNIDIHIRGGSTAYAPKKHFKLKFNHGHKFEFDPDVDRVDEINLNSTYSDKTYIRQPLAFEMYDWVGSPGPESFPVRAERNGEFFGISIFIEEPEEELLEREGLDPDGALYKMYNTFKAGGWAEKKTREWEGRTDLDSFCTNINDLTGNELHNYIMDNVDLPRTLAYLVATILVHQNDHPHKNHYLYCDTDGSGEWFFMPWDHDLTWGSNWDGSSYHDTIYADDDQIPGKSTDVKPSHPFLGRSDAKEWNYHWNNLIDALLRDPIVKNMFRRRLRTCMDEFLKAPGTQYSERPIENRIDEMYSQMGPELQLDYEKWADPWTWGGQEGYPKDQTPAQAVDILKNDYLDVRRTHLFVTHNVDNAAAYSIPNSFSAEIPNSQPADLAISFGSYDFNPASANQDEEYIQLINPNDFYADISGWKLTGGIEHTFRKGTVIPASGSLYVSPNVRTFRQRATSPTGGEGLFVQGNYDGHLSSWGETVRLIDTNNSEAAILTYPPAPSDQQRFIRITEFMYHPTVGSGFNEEEFEYIELKNIGTQSVLLDGMKLTDGIYYTFPQDGNLTLGAGEYIIIAKNRQAFESRYDTSDLALAPGQYAGYLSNSGEKIKLEDTTNSTILEFDYSDNWYEITDGQGYSMTIRDEDSSPLQTWDDKDGWRPSVVPGGSPGYCDAGTLPPLDSIKINEILAHSHSDAPDWIELHNTTDEPINIGGWFISDKEAEPTRYRIALGTVIPAGGYLVLYEDQHFGNPSDPGCNTPFAFSENGETAYLRSASSHQPTGYVEQEDFGPSATGVSFGRYELSDGTHDFTAMRTQTPGQPNSYPAVGPIVISEIMYNPPDGGSYDNDEYEYIELTNVSGTTVVLQDYDADKMMHVPWKFTDGVEFTFPLGVSVAPGETILVVKNTSAFAERYSDVTTQIFGPFESDTNLSNGGEDLELAMPGDIDQAGERCYIRVERVDYDDDSPWPDPTDGDGSSLHRVDLNSYSNDVSNWTALTPSPGN
ncbi:lamin tail domain-containing protein [Anaerohalosphaera lusitana]|nr:lamin tail domain-containing protein [Anaerohalosphaera lusitana]